MKRSDLLRHLRRYGCILKREGASHSLWMNPATGAMEAIPRHTKLKTCWLEKFVEVCPFLTLNDYKS
jgi:hypothetical protein